ncbi:hypothetical protein [Streptomyces sp. NPDC093094]|uniref:hypothetical protein n=1 Tax=Streptomyces sp. NPDC093094 TaxID=3366026 RepID=UPI003829DCD3
MHEMWRGADASGSWVWHVLVADKSWTMCGMAKQEDVHGGESTDRHCLACMQVFQDEVL